MASLSSEDLALEAALATSAAEAAARVSAPVRLAKTGNNDEHPRPRSSFDAPLQHHFASTHGTQARRGVIKSVGVLNQFHPFWSPLQRKYGTAASMCGYFTAAEVGLLRQRLSELQQTPDTSLIDSSTIITAMLLHVRDESLMSKSVERHMAIVHASRCEWIQSHPELFPDGVDSRAGRNHLRGWVANYELSDCIASDMKAQLSMGITTSQSCVFMRHNQFPEISDATPDEYVHILAEEQRFGGRRLSNGKFEYAENDSRFFVECFVRANTTQASDTLIRRERQTPEEFQEEKAKAAADVTAAAAASESKNGGTSDSAGISSVRIFAWDLNGHFSAGFSFIDPESMDPVLVFLNTTETNYVGMKPMVVWTYDLFFPPSVGTTVEPASGAVAVPSEALEQLQAMGFSKERAQQAVVQACGNISVAVDLLMADDEPA